MYEPGEKLLHSSNKSRLHCDAVGDILFQNLNSDGGNESIVFVVSGEEKRNQMR